jgi:protein-disulfide isomerase
MASAGVKRVAKSEKHASPRGSGKEPAEAAQGQATGQRTLGILLTVAVVAAAIAGGLYWRSQSESGAGSGEPGDKKDPEIAELMAAGPLEDISLGKVDAPNTIVEYSSMTCPHCAQFHTDVLPELQKKYIDNGQARLILREFPLDGLAVAAFMLARCAGPDRYYPMVNALFETQKTWAMPGADGKEKLLMIAKQAGFSKEKFDQCLADKELFDKIVAVRTRAPEKYGVESTPQFFVNGKRLGPEHEVKDFDALLGGGTATSEGPATAGGSPSQTEEAPAQ